MRESDDAASNEPALAFLAPEEFFSRFLDAIRAAPGVVVEGLAERRARRSAEISGADARNRATGAYVVVAGAYSAASLRETESLLGPTCRLLVLYPSPEEFIARKLAAGDDAAGAREAWKRDAAALLEAASRLQRRITLIDARRAASAPIDFRFFCGDRFKLAIGDLDVATDDVVAPIDAYLARSLIQEDVRAKALRDELSAISFPLGSEYGEAQFSDAYDELRALKADRRALGGAVRDAELLRGQLHLAQYQIEARFKRTEKRLLDLAEKDVAAAEAERIALAGELAAMKASPVWKLAAPMRRLAGLWRQNGFGPNSHRRMAQIIRSSPHFDADWYLAQNKDIAGRGMDPALHYVRHGGKEGRAPGPNFNGTAYLAANPDLLGKGVNPLVHYILHGEKEGRAISPRATVARRKK